jgi:hypothetical protein
MTTQEPKTSVTTSGSERAITGLATLQFAIGGLFDAEPVGHEIHLVRSSPRRGTLCGLDQFAPESPGWSVGGGVSDDQAIPCPRCVEVRDAEFRYLPVRGSMFGGLFR